MKQLLIDLLTNILIEAFKQLAPMILSLLLQIADPGIDHICPPCMVIPHLQQASLINKLQFC